jgi:(2Fe-2S) ferredoxin
MLQPRTHYEQVSMEIVRRIVEKQIQRDSIIEEDQEIRNETLGEHLIGKQQQTAADSGAFFEREITRKS